MYVRVSKNLSIYLSLFTCLGAFGVSARVRLFQKRLLSLCDVYLYIRYSIYLLKGRKIESVFPQSYKTTNKKMRAFSSSSLADAVVAFSSNDNNNTKRRERRRAKKAVSFCARRSRSRSQEKAAIIRAFFDDDDLTVGKKSFGRRETAVVAATLLLSSFSSTRAEEAHALQLAPLGKPEHVGGEKRVGVSVKEVREILERDLQPIEKLSDGTFKGAYFVTGNLTPEIFEDDCAFIDPTNTTKSLSKYMNALKILFDPETSSVDLKSIDIVDDHTIVGVYDCEGYLKLPWHPRVKPYTGTVTWKTNENGLIQSQLQSWTGISAAGAIMESFTPGS